MSYTDTHRVEGDFMTLSTVFCDECRHQFAPHPTETPIDGGGVIIAFSCPGCGRDYQVAKITARGIRLRDLLAEAVRSGDRRLATRLRKRYQAEVTLLTGKRAHKRPEVRPLNLG